MTPQACKLVLSSKGFDLNAFDALIVPIHLDHTKDKSWQQQLKNLPPAIADAITNYGKKAEIKAEEGNSMAFDFSLDLRVAIVFSNNSTEMFRLLTYAREVLAKFKGCGIQQIALDIRQHPRVHEIMEAFAAALVARNFEPPKISGSKAEQEQNKKDKFWTMSVVVGEEQGEQLAQALKQTEATALGTNLVRSLVMQPGNKLTPESYVQEIKELAESLGLKFEFWNQKKLKSMNAGAFLAVVQGSSHQDSGIVKLSYRPGTTHARKLVLVGKGITYDTGGVNLKPARSMFGMNGDMAGSAVALALTQLAVQESWPYQLNTFLAIADNAIGENAYRPNDIVISAKGKSIEVVHTDAEGRMILADTLHFASKEKGDLMMDFATLTGACVSAISSTYSGAFTNRPEWFDKILAIGRKTGERVWPFPLDEDFGDCLKSDVADIKQCRLSGGVDHIEAAYFLKEFVDQDVPWLHLDLSSAQNPGGLAHVETETTGFGVRFASAFIHDILAKN